jgi:hypothetical protein
MSALKLLDDLINLLGEKVVVRILEALLDGSKEAVLKANAELAKRTYRRGP